MKNYVILFTLTLIYCSTPEGQFTPNDYISHGEIGGNNNQFNEISAVTSASGTFKIIEGKTYPTFAEITWYDEYNNGDEHTIKWGKTTAYEDKIDLSPFVALKNVTTRINGLIPNTQYRGQFFRPYDGLAHSTKFTFRTPAIE